MVFPQRATKFKSCHVSLITGKQQERTFLCSPSDRLQTPGHGVQAALAWEALRTHSAGQLNHAVLCRILAASELLFRSLQEPQEPQTLSTPSLPPSLKASPAAAFWQDKPLRVSYCPLSEAVFSPHNYPAGVWLSQKISLGASNNGQHPSAQCRLERTLAVPLLFKRHVLGFSSFALALVRATLGYFYKPTRNARTPNLSPPTLPF